MHDPVEIKVEQLIQGFNQVAGVQAAGYGSVIIRDAREWRWNGKPKSEQVSSARAPKIRRSFSQGASATTASAAGLDLTDIYTLVDACIRTASTMECLTSTISYIRKCKQYYVDQEKREAREALINTRRAYE